MIDHLSVVVSDYAKSKAFYLQALAPTGHSRLVELPATQGGQKESTGFCHADGSDVSRGSVTRVRVSPPSRRRHRRSCTRRRRAASP